MAPSGVRLARLEGEGTSGVAAMVFALAASASPSGADREKHLAARDCGHGVV